MIFDCFTFYDEFLLLDMRLAELGDVVDRFVLVESPVTHQGRPKPLHFQERKEAYRQWGDRIIHVVAELPEQGGAWDRENAQRRAIARGLSGADPDDLVISGDADEIPRAEAVRYLAATVSNPVRLEYRLHYYKLNLRATYDEPWDLARALRRRDVDDLSALRTPIVAESVPDAGWHFSYLMSPERIAEKLDTFAHVEFNKDEYKSPTHIRRCLDLGCDLFGRGVMSVEPVGRLPGLDPFMARESGLVHPGRGPVRLLLAYVYCVLTRYRERYPTTSFDRAPYLFVPAASVFLAWELLSRLGRKLRAVRPRP